jgi:hypothetical protein
MALSIQTPGPPPERHADRLVAEMLRHLAVTRAQLSHRIAAAIISSSDGSPKAQRKMHDRLLRAGATWATLTPGKRGRYSLYFFDWTGWDPARGEEIKVDDPIPPRPQIVCWINWIKSEGRGRHEVGIKTAPFLFVTHHALSRAAQRLGARSLADLEAAVAMLSNTALTLLVKKDIGLSDDDEKWATVPPMGWRVPLLTDSGSSPFVVLKKHDALPALVAATVITPEEADR